MDVRYTLKDLWKCLTTEAANMYTCVKLNDAFQYQAWNIPRNVARQTAPIVYILFSYFRITNTIDSMDVNLTSSYQYMALP